MEYDAIFRLEIKKGVYPYWRIRCAMILWQIFLFLATGKIVRFQERK